MVFKYLGTWVGKGTVRLQGSLASVAHVPPGGPVFTCRASSIPYRVPISLHVSVISVVCRVCVCMNDDDVCLSGQNQVAKVLEQTNNREQTSEDFEAVCLYNNLGTQYLKSRYLPPPVSHCRGVSISPFWSTLAHHGQWCCDGRHFSFEPRREHWIASTQPQNTLTRTRAPFCSLMATNSLPNNPWTPPNP